MPLSVSALCIYFEDETAKIYLFLNLNIFILLYKIPFDIHHHKLRMRVVARGCQITIGYISDTVLKNKIP